MILSSSFSKKTRRHKRKREELGDVSIGGSRNIPASGLAMGSSLSFVVPPTQMSCLLNVRLHSCCKSTLLAGLSKTRPRVGVGPEGLPQPWENL